MIVNWTGMNTENRYSADRRGRLHQHQQTWRHYQDSQQSQDHWHWETSCVLWSDWRTEGQRWHWRISALRREQRERELWEKEEEEILKLLETYIFYIYIYHETWMRWINLKSMLLFKNVLFDFLVSLSSRYKNCIKQKAQKGDERWKLLWRREHPSGPVFLLL